MSAAIHTRFGHMENAEQRAARVAHDPDTNPDWVPKVAIRIYACTGCDAQTRIQTNHTGRCSALCMGTCRDIFNPNTARERVRWHPERVHYYIREAE